MRLANVLLQDDRKKNNMTAVKQTDGTSRSLWLNETWQVDKCHFVQGLAVSKRVNATTKLAE